ncbi:MAG: AraC family transcriptional regulator [Balneolaceae bacterium]
MNSLENNGNDGLSASNTKLYVRYMVSLRCKNIAKAELNKLNIKHAISLQGAIEFPEGITNAQHSQLKKNLLKSRLLLLDANESLVIDKIINTIIEVIHFSDELPKISYKDIIQENLGAGEAMLKIFTEVKGVSVTQFIIDQKIERAKELLLYHDITTSEIAEKLNYKNVDLFISQFKKITGHTPSYFIDIKSKRVKNIENQ